MTHPDFMGIGAQRGGTSWLWTNLRKHNGIWMPPRKEIHYFDRSPRYPSPSHLASDRFLDRLFGREPCHKLFRESLFRDVRSKLLERDWNGMTWMLRYYMGTYNDDWYLSLFKGGQQKIKGEITPAYAILDPRDVEAIQKLMPSLKVIFLIRNPIDRAWSHIRFFWTTGSYEDMDSIHRLKSFCDDPQQELRSDYIRTIDIWRTFFSEKHFFVAFYDDIVEAPEILLTTIFEFIGVDPRAFDMGQMSRERINASRERKIPKELEAFLAEKYYSQIETLNQRFGGHTRSWLEEAKEILARPR